MPLPKVSISLSNGALGAIAPGADGVCGLVLTGVSVTGGITAGVPTPIYALADAENKGITATGTNAAAWRHIKEFYDLAGASAELWIMLVANTVTLAQMADNTNTSGAKKLLDAAQGRIRLLGLARTPGTGYTPTLTNGIDSDSITAVTNAHAMANAYAALQQPLRVLVEGRSFAIANIASVKDLTSLTCNRASIVLVSSVSDGSASVGIALGKAAALPVQRNIGRVKDGALPYAENSLYVGDTAVEGLGGAADTLHDKGYIIARRFVGITGYFLNDDPMCAPATDDYSSLAHGRVIDKAQRIAYATYVNELNDEVEIDDAGHIVAGTIRYLESRITQQISAAMAGEISGVTAYINPEQNILSTNQLNVQLRIVPVGYFKEIIVDLGFRNPAL